MNALANALTTALINFAWQGVLVACLLWITLFLLRNRSAKARYLASCLALLAMTITPVITGLLYVTGGKSGALHAEVNPALLGAILHAPDAAWTPESSVPWLLLIQQWIIPIWSLGVLLFSCRLIFGYFRLSRFKRSGTPVPDAVSRVVDDLAERMGLARQVRTLQSMLAESPSVAGFVRPIILLPVSSISGLAPQQLEAILAHELAHIRRLDPIVNALQVLIETLLFYHPAVWWTSARIRHERELCCDDLAISCCGDALGYARALTTLEKLRGVPALAIGSTGGSLLFRIRRILGERPTDYSPSRVSGILALSLAMACLAVSIGTRVQAQNVPQSTTTVFQGPGVVAEATDAVAVVPIRYPRPAAEKAIQGTVVVQADVDAQGNVTDARVLSGPPELRKAVLQPVLTWRFKSDGRASTRQVSVAFQVPPLQELETRENRELGSVLEREALIRQKMELAAVNQQFAESASELEQRRQHLRALESQMDQLKRLNDFKHFEERSAEQAQGAMAEEAAKVRENVAELERQVEKSRSVAGRVLARIDVVGLSDEQRERLVRQLPIRIGDTLSPESREIVGQTIHGFDKQLRFELVLLDNNQAVLEIAGPGEPTYWAARDDRKAEIERITKEIQRGEGQLAIALQQYSERHPDIINFQHKLQELRHRRDDLTKQEAFAGTEGHLAR